MKSCGGQFFNQLICTRSQSWARRGPFLPLKQYVCVWTETRLLAIFALKNQSINRSAKWALLVIGISREETVLTNCRRFAWALMCTWSNNIQMWNSFTEIQSAIFIDFYIYLLFCFAENDCRLPICWYAMHFGAGDGELKKEKKKKRKKKRAK